MKKVLMTLCAIGIVAVGCETREQKTIYHDNSVQHRTEAVRPAEVKPAETRPLDPRAVELKNEIRNEIKNGLKPAAPNGR
jgi:hypothetical protein